MFWQRKLDAFHRPQEFRTAFAIYKSRFDIESLQRSPKIMITTDYVRATAQVVIIASFRRFAASTVPQRKV